MEGSGISGSDGKVALAAVGAACGTMALWSGTPIANKVAVGYMDGLSAGVLRSMLAGFVALGVCLVMRMPFPAERRDRGLLLLAGLSSFAVWPALMSMGIARTTAGHAGLIAAVVPILAVLGVSVIDGHRLRVGWWVGAAIAFGATGLLIVGTGDAGAEGASVPGDLIVLAGSFVCAVGYVAGGKLSPRIGTVAVTFWGLSVALIALVPTFALIVRRTDWGAVPMTGWLAVGWMTFLSSLLGYSLWFFALGHGGIRRIGSMQLALPVTTLLAAVVVLGDVVTFRVGVVCVMILVGTFWAQRSAG